MSVEQPAWFPGKNTYSREIVQNFYKDFEYIL